MKTQSLKVHSCKLYNNKYMIASTQITNTKIFAFTVVPDFNTFTAEGFSEIRPFKHLSKHVFRSQ